MTSKACGAAGPAIPAEYKEEGSYQTLRSRNGELKCYVVGSVKPPSVNAIVLMYDIFGWNECNRNVFRVADRLAAEGFLVLMPDFYRGKPWPLKDMPPKDRKVSNQARARAPSDIRSPYPSSTQQEFMKWKGTVADVKSADIDLKTAVVPFIRKFAKGVKMASIGLLGFCWGGDTAFAVAGFDQSFTFRAIGSIHGGRVTPELASKIKCPALVGPSKTDPENGPIKAVLDSKPFGKQCVYTRFDKSGHGFMASRGDWRDEQTAADVDKAFKLSVDFFKKMASY